MTPLLQRQRRGVVQVVAVRELGLTPVEGGFVRMDGRGRGRMVAVDKPGVFQPTRQQPLRSPVPTAHSSAISLTVKTVYSSPTSTSPPSATRRSSSTSASNTAVTSGTGYLLLRTGAATPESLASGFLRIAVQSMANAIKRISVARGYDVTGYTLQCFGGAGGQHACAVADALGMRQVLIHPLAGVLSAYGMGLADQIAMREASVELPLDDAAQRNGPNDDIGEAKRLELYRLQVLLRESEQRAFDLFLQNQIKGTSHLSLGQEAIAAGCAAAMTSARQLAPNSVFNSSRRWGSLSARLRTPTTTDHLSFLNSADRLCRV